MRTLSGDFDLSGLAGLLVADIYLVPIRGCSSTVSWVGAEEPVVGSELPLTVTAAGCVVVTTVAMIVFLLCQVNDCSVLTQVPLMVYQVSKSSTVSVVVS